ncbi:MAG: hypothetical protein JXP34_13610 [Planctomycetes bacterium]|nr:hypothetical protein [Planctomycetota bacterium]
MLRLVTGLAIAALVSDPRAPGAETPSRFTPLVALPNPEIIASAPAFPGGGFEAANILDGRSGGGGRTEYASDSGGVETFIDFAFPSATAIAGFKHIDRRDPATVSSSELIFAGTPDFAAPIARIPVRHANAPGATTLLPFPPITARYIRWKVTGIASYATVGGAEIAFLAPAEPEAAPSRARIEARVLPGLIERDGLRLQPLRATIAYPYAEPCPATLAIDGGTPIPVDLRPDSVEVEALVPAAGAPGATRITLTAIGRQVASCEVARKAPRDWTIYILPHSHNDIGYTHVQTEVERKQWEYLEQAIEIARRTADDPPEARFRWNCEVVWAVESYLAQATPEKEKAFAEAVRKGWLHIDALYANELTGLCRPEELFRLLEPARRISRRYDIPIDAAMVSDVPGYTWGIVPALARSGVRWFSIGTNHVHRIGRAIEAHGDRPFWWVSPSGREKVLCWVAGHGYSWFHPGLLGPIGRARTAAFLEEIDRLEARGFPYDMLPLRYSIGGDNGPPDPELPEFVREWNRTHLSPKLAIATTREFFREFERRYGDTLPKLRGDFTPYWEDGAASSARETALNRAAAERLTQAEAIWSLRDPGRYPADRFRAAWRNVILYDEHTWGAHCSITEPDSPFTRDQWKIKQAFALDADAQSKALLAEALGSDPRPAEGSPAAIDVYNTASWPRTDLVILRREWAPQGMTVRDEGGGSVPSQRLSTGQLAFLASDVPPLGAKRFLLRPGEPAATGEARAEGYEIGNGRVRVSIDGATGGIESLWADGIPSDLVARGGPGLDAYLYIAGREPKDPKTSSGARVIVREKGPLVAAMEIRARAPGCRAFVRGIRVVDGIARVDIVNVLARERIRTPEGVHLGFGFRVPDPTVRIDVPWAVVRPEVDQLAGACRNYFCVGRWVDIANDRFGVTWATIDAPLLEIGGIRVDVPSPFDPNVWVDRIEPSATILSYVMNNYWETNYKADNEGGARFAYSIRPHGGFDAAAASRFGIERSQPLIAVPAPAKAAARGSLLRVIPDEVIVSSIAPSEDGAAWIVRLFNVSDRPARARIEWSAPAPEDVRMSNPFEDEGEPIEGPIEMPGYGIVTLRATRP